MAMKAVLDKRTIHVAVVAGSPAVARACIDAFDGVTDCSLLAVITSAVDGTRALPSLGPDVVVFDGASGSAAGVSGVPVVFLGFTGKGRPGGAVVQKAEHLPDAVRHAAHEVVGHDGNGWIPARTAADGQLATLSRREREVVEMIVQSYSYKEIAGRLGVGVSTIGTHMNHIYRKLDVSTRREIVARYGPALAGR